MPYAFKVIAKQNISGSKFRLVRRNRKRGRRADWWHPDSHYL